MNHASNRAQLPVGMEENHNDERFALRQKQEIPISERTENLCRADS